MRFWELKEKEVINCKDGKRLGYVTDLEFDECSGQICRLFVPAKGKLLGCMGKTSEYHIEYKDISKIGKDILLVNIDEKNRLKPCKD